MLSLATRRLIGAITPRATVTTTFNRSFATVGDKLPSVDLHIRFPPKKHNVAAFAEDKSILLVGLPGTFTPT